VLDVTNTGWNRVWVSAIFFVKKIPKGRQEKRSDFLIPNSKNSLKFRHSLITLVMKFHEILMWNKFIEEISLMYFHIPSTRYDSFIVSFPPLNFIHVQSLNIHEISFVLWMKWDENSRSKSRSFFFFSINKILFVIIVICTNVGSTIHLKTLVTMWP